jgi:PIN domain nuclease of toxin-antitoxin system
VRLLLDTHAFVWWIEDSVRLSAHARAAIADRRNDIFVSAVVGWELAIKQALGKLQSKRPVVEFVPEQIAMNGFRTLPVEMAHALRVSELPLHHGDPFDRLPVAQSDVEEMSLVTGDRVISRYGVSIIW